MARQKLGQHFLADVEWRENIRETLSIRPGERWLEIGAGHGEMTELLAQSGAIVIAIETDARLATGLRRRAAGWESVEIVEGDVLALDLGKIAGERFHAYGNLPYYITSPILRRLFEVASQIKSMHVVLQLEVAERIVAHPGRRNYGFLSVLCQFFSNPEIVLRIPRIAFRPPPKVTSALVKITPPGAGASLGIADSTRFLEFVQKCFGQKRKTLRNNWRGTPKAEDFDAAMVACGLAPDARAEQLSLAQFAALYQGLKI